MHPYRCRMKAEVRSDGLANKSALCLRQLLETAASTWQRRWISFVERDHVLLLWGEGDACCALELVEAASHVCNLSSALYYIRLLFIASGPPGGERSRVTRQLNMLPNPLHAVHLAAQSHPHHRYPILIIAFQHSHPTAPVETALVFHAVSFYRGSQSDFQLSGGEPSNVGSVPLVAYADSPRQWSLWNQAFMQPELPHIVTFQTCRIFKSRAGEDIGRDARTQLRE